MSKESPIELLTVRETAAYLKLSEGTVRRCIADGRLKVIRNGRLIRIHPDAVQDLLEPVVPYPGYYARSSKARKPASADESLQSKGA